MTRDEAIGKLATSKQERRSRGLYSPLEDATVAVDDLIALGLLKLDEPKSEQKLFQSQSVKFDDGVHVSQLGKSLRDWFAGNALSGHMATWDGPPLAAHIAKSAYAMADAMMAERAKLNGGAS